MLGQILSALALLKQIWDAIAVFLGFVKKEVHEHEQKDIDQKAGEAGDPSKSLEDRLKAGQDLENKQNDHS